MSRMSRGSHGSEKSQNCSMSRMSQLSRHIGPKIPALYEHVTYVTHVTGILRAFFLKSKCMSRWSHGSKNPKLSCTLCHIYECHTCHRDLVLEFSDKNTKTMSQVHVTQACHICPFFALSGAISRKIIVNIVLKDNSGATSLERGTNISPSRPNTPLILISA